MDESYTVSDGKVKDGEGVWWACVSGAKRVEATDEHRLNISRFPYLYSRAMPVAKKQQDRDT